MRTVSLMTANQQFSRLIREVEGGEDIVITRRGRPIARLVPHLEDKIADPQWAAAYGRMMERLETLKALRLAGCVSGGTSSMTVNGRFSLDTNILVYAVDRDAGERHRRSRALIGQAAKRDCVLTVQSLAEFFHATTRRTSSTPRARAAFCAAGAMSSR